MYADIQHSCVNNWFYERPNNYNQIISKAAYFNTYYHTECDTESYECYLYVIKPVPCVHC